MYRRQAGAPRFGEVHRQAVPTLLRSTAFPLPAEAPGRCPTCGSIGSGRPRGSRRAATANCRRAASVSTPPVDPGDRPAARSGRSSRDTSRRTIPPRCRAFRYEFPCAERFRRRARSCSRRVRGAHPLRDPSKRHQRGQATGPNGLAASTRPPLTTILPDFDDCRAFSRQRKPVAAGCRDVIKSVAAVRYRSCSGSRNDFPVAETVAPASLTAVSGTFERGV